MKTSFRKFLRKTLCVLILSVIFFVSGLDVIPLSLVCEFGVLPDMITHIYMRYGGIKHQNIIIYSIARKRQYGINYSIRLMLDRDSEKILTGLRICTAIQRLKAYNVSELELKINEVYHNVASYDNLQIKLELGEVYANLNLEISSEVKHWILLGLSSADMNIQYKAFLVIQRYKQKAKVLEEYLKELIQFSQEAKKAWIQDTLDSIR